MPALAESEKNTLRILRIKFFLTDNIVVDSHARKDVILPFIRECESPLFTGNILPDGVDTQRIEKDGRCSLSAGADDQPAVLLLLKRHWTPPPQDNLAERTGVRLRLSPNWRMKFPAAKDTA